jgi:tetratricopeptide (TPR) repeat protein
MEWHDKSLAAFEQALALSPESRFYSFDVIAAQAESAVLLRELGRFDECAVLVDSARERLRPLLRDFPESRRYATQQCTLDEVQALNNARQGRLAEGIELFESSAHAREQLLLRYPADAGLVHQTASLYNNLGAAYTEQRERFDLSRAALARAMQLLELLPGVVRSNERVQRLEHIVRYSTMLVYCLSDEHEQVRPMIAAESARADGAFELRYAADLWNEYILALRRALPDELERADLEGDARAQFLTTLGQAIDAGYADAGELSANPALASFRNDPEFSALLQRLPHQ